MKWTGNNTLYLPQVRTISFVMKDIVTDSYGNYDVMVDGLTSPYNYTNIAQTIRLFSLSGGFVCYGPNAANLTKGATYNTGEPFTISGWYDANTGVWINANGSQMYAGNLAANSPVGQFRVNCPFSGSLKADLTIKTQPINLYAMVSGFNIGSTPQGQLLSDTNMPLFDIDTFFYKSYEQLLIPSGSTRMILTGNQPKTINFQDGDSSYQNNRILGTLNLTPLWGNQSFNIDVNRVIPIKTYLNFTGLNNNPYFGGPFMGTWYANKFTYNDKPSVLTMNYRMDLYDSFGNFLTKPIQWSITDFSGKSTGTYITGFKVTSSGEYTKQPNVLFSGYYCITGIQQTLNSMLFSSGCTGNIPVSYRAIGKLGTGASGVLLTHPVIFQDLYSAGLQTYYVVDNYQSYTNGTGYTEAPTAVFNTGIYGSNCYDVPAKFNSNKAWFTASNTRGATSSLADYLTGVALMGTGLVSGGLATGYVVTGLDIWNLGSGYSNIFIPSCTFVRQTGDTLSKNASGIFNLTSGLVNVLSNTSISFRIGNGDWMQRNTGSGINETLPVNETNFSFKFSISGASNTIPYTGLLSIGYVSSTGVVNMVKDKIIFSHSFDTTNDTLKKNYLNTGLTGVPYPVGTLLNFTITQSELDSLYSSTDWINNSNGGLDIGDLNF